MSNLFSTYQLGEVAEIIAGGDKPKVFSLEKEAPIRVPVLANAEKNNGLLGYTDNARIFEPAVTVAARGSNVGFVAVRKEPFFPVVRLLSLIPKKERLDVDYLYYNLKQNRKTGTGSGQPQITIPDISSKTISLPPISVQKKVAEVLSVLDKKIELNNSINAELEAMAKTLYDYWFVQFDFPDVNGKPYKSSGGKMVYNPTLKCEIPEGWDVKRIGDVSQIKAGGDKPVNFSDVKTNEYMIPIFSNGVSDDGLYGFTNQSVVDQPSITVSARGTIGFSVLRTKPFVPIIRLIVLIPLCSSDINFLYESVKWIGFDNSGSVQKQLTVPQISSLNIIYPPASLREKYSSLVSSSASKIDSLKEENQSLIALRDWLLPMLMNGQVTVK